MKATFIITNFKRSKNLPLIIESIKAQTIESEIFIWNNNPSEFLTQDMFAHKIDILINSSSNLFCRPRWDLCKFAKNDYVIILDDDICFSNNHVAAHILFEAKNNYAIGRFFGVEGVLLDENDNYFDLDSTEKMIIHQSMPLRNHQPIHFANPEKNINVDIVKGRLICLNKNDLLASLPPQTFIDKADDITYLLWFSRNDKYHMLIGGCQEGIKDFEDKNATYALSMENNWKAYRNSVVKEMLKLKRHHLLAID